MQRSNTVDIRVSQEELAILSKPREKLVVAGGGPAGLFAVVLGLQKGIADITLIDKRLYDEYTRTGSVSETIFFEASKMLGREVEFSESFHIKDFERSLWEMIKGTKVKLIKGTVQSFVNATCTVTTDEGVKLIPYDILLLCTGSKELIQSNDMGFEIKTFHECVMKNYIYTRIDLSEVHGRALEEKFKIFVHHVHPGGAFDIKNAEHVQIIEKIREMGWQYYSMPECYVHLLGKGKAALYVEAPANLDKNDKATLEKWVRTVVPSDDRVIPKQFKILTTTNKTVEDNINYIFVDPMQVTPLFAHGDNASIVIPSGNLLVNVPFTTSRNLLHGFCQVHAFMEALTVKDGVVTFILLPQYQMQEEGLLNELKTARMIPLNEKNKVKIKQGERARALILVNQTDAAIVANQADAAILANQAHTDLVTLAKESKVTADAIALHDLVGKMLAQALKFCPKEESEQLNKIKNDLQYHAELCKNLGNIAIRKDPNTAATFYALSLGHYLNHFPDKYDDIIIRYSNIMVAATMLGDSGWVLGYAQKAEEVLVHVSAEKKAQFANKILLYKTLATFDMLNKALLKSATVMGLENILQVLGDNIAKLVSAKALATKKNDFDNQLGQLVSNLKKHSLFSETAPENPVNVVIQKIKTNLAKG